MLGFKWQAQYATGGPTQTTQLKGAFGKYSSQMLLFQHQIFINVSP